jgi:ABC-type branched-subunit amino acid transport system ATPase component/ABC-type branched-subunit amino acid transport system permease subunit
MTLGVNVLLSMLAAVLGAVLVAVLIGWPALRLKTHYFALASFGIAEIVRSVATNWKAVTRGTDGITQIPPPGLGGVMLSEDWHFYYFLLVAGAVLTVAYRRVLASTYGRAFTAIRQGEVAAELLGINVTHIKLLAFGLSAAYAGFAGAAYAHLFSVVSPDVFSFENASVPILVSLFVGGSGSAGGALIGSAVVVLLPEVLRVTGQWYLAVYGVGILLLMAYMPDGISTRVQRIWRGYGKPRTVEVAAVRPPSTTWSNGAGYRESPVDLRLDGVTKRFGGVLAVDDVSLRVEPGKITSIIGPNGAGKTTVLNLVTGVYRPDSGSIRFGTRELIGEASHGVAAAGVLRSFQNVRVWKDLSVAENVMVPLHPSQGTTLPGVLLSTARVRAVEATARARAEEVLEFVGLGDLRNAPAGSLPHGHLRLLELGRCLVASPKLILLDEPAAGLNQQEGELLRERLRAVCAIGIGIVLIEHNMHFVMSISDRVMVMTGGRMLAEGTPREIQSNDAVIEAYLGEDVSHAFR